MATMAGGAGAGGAGAGGAGAGGAGAGGAGAGGAGAGGAGAGGAGGGHSGGPSSPLLSTALIVTHDAIGGFWDGSAGGGKPLGRLPAPGDLTHLDPSRRIDMLVSELGSRFSLTGTASRMSEAKTPKYMPGQAVLSLDGKTLCTLQAPDVPALESQLVWLRNYADLRLDRLPEINIQINDILSFFGAQAQLDSAARRRSLELMIATQRLTYMLVMRVKSLTWTPRPIDLSNRVQPVVQTPDHSSFPSGHATEAFALATVLSQMAFSQAPAAAVAASALPYRLAHRIATNRVVAGVHYPIDSAAGAHLGCAIGAAVWSILQDADASLETAYAVIDTDPAQDFLLSTFQPGTNATTGHSGKRGPVGAEYAGKVAAEWGAV